MTLESSDTWHQENEKAIRQVVGRLQSGYDNKSGEVFASAFAPVHDYVVINGMLVPGMTREANAQVHQELFSGTRMGSLGDNLRDLNVQCEVRNIRFLTPEIAVVHIATIIDGHAGTMVSAVMQKQEDEWLIATYHNAPVMQGPPGGPPP